MAGTTYDMTKKVEVIGEVTNGLAFVTIKLDFTKLPVAAADDNWQVLALKDGWILYDGYTRIPTASSSTATVDIGTAEDGTELDAAVDLSSAATDPTVMDTLVAGTPIIVTADGYIWLDFNTASVSDGTMEIHLLIAALPGEDSKTS
jgi:hypothetical protein